MVFKFVILALACVLLQEANGHGRMLDPANRSSVWRYFPGYPANYNDNGIQCTRCGPCGDGAGQPQPQANQNGGIYGKGKVVRTYKSGQTIDVHVELTANHRGTFQFYLCVLSSPTAIDTESCFQQLSFEDGTKDFAVPAGKDIRPRVKLPAGLKCARCVLRWHYMARNTGETYRNCADISIE